MSEDYFFCRTLYKLGPPHGGGGRSGSGGRLWAGRGRSQAPCRRPHRKLKLESTDVKDFTKRLKACVQVNGGHFEHLMCLLLMQRSWCIFYQNFVFGRNKKWKFFGDIN